MKRLLLLLAALTLPSAAYAQFPSQNITLPAFVIPASAVNGGGTLSTACLTFPLGTPLCEEAAQALAQRNTTNAQAFRVYNTFTDASNYERINIGWASNIALVTVGALGTGQSRVLRIGTDATSSGNLSLMTGGTERWTLGGSTGTETTTQATPGVNVQVLQTTATNDDPVENVRQQRVTTTDATPTTIDTITIPASTTMGISCTVINRRTGGVSGSAEDGAYYEVKVAMKNVAGTATEIAAEVLTVIGESIAGYTVTAAPTGATELIQVTGAVTTNITWHSTCRTYLVGS